MVCSCDEPKWQKLPSGRMKCANCGGQAMTPTAQKDRP